MAADHTAPTIAPPVSDLLAPRQPGDLLQLRQAELSGDPFLVYRDSSGAQRIVTLAGRDRLVIGRRRVSDVFIDWDEQVSRTHAELERVGAEWAVVDDGLSRNGTFVNSERLHGRRRLNDRDVLRVGRTALSYREPASVGSIPTVRPEALAAMIELSPAQRRVLAALCRPCVEATGRLSPATNDEIAQELSLSVEAVKSHLRVLFGKFAIRDLPQNRKRVQLVSLAIEYGLVNP